MPKRTADGAPKHPQRPAAPRREATLYDAAAGRVGYESFLRPPRRSSGRDTATTSSKPVGPDEVLFRQKRAPTRYEETDAYFASGRLPDTPLHRLPGSELLGAVHAYAADLYASGKEKGERGKSLDYRSMDETALLAMGILLEEAVAAEIGPTGDLAFVEGDDADAGESLALRDGIWDGREFRRRVSRRDGESKRARAGHVASRQRDAQPDASRP